MVSHLHRCTVLAGVLLFAAGCGKSKDLSVAMADGGALSEADSRGIIFVGGIPQRPPVVDKTRILPRPFEPKQGAEARH